MNKSTFSEPHIYLLEGPIGAGKTTYARQLSQKISAPHFNLDNWMAKLFESDKPKTPCIDWYLERKSRCLEVIYDMAHRVLLTNKKIILELGLVQRVSRNQFYQWVNKVGFDLQVLVLNAPRSIRKERVKKRNIEKNESFSMEVSEDFFNFCSDIWEEPLVDEKKEVQIKFISYKSTSNLKL
ncbi:AAA family ATPase [Marinicella sp. W31]|uniref:AAA family ATPase n=1 Tax=Marinicella sp. W31 TaxID=3023713 RepID=UPI003756BA1E